ncbi:MAG: hypothetical protein F4X35_02090 [Alphaproteobacteria bacterium]|nr:hypothetical protein [Alphaproteobacteria bacterium]
MSAAVALSLDDVLKLARAYARARETLQGIVDEIHDEQRKAVRERRRRLTDAIARTSAARDGLEAAIDGHHALFEKPRTQTVDGIKFGLRKQPGAVTFADEAKVIARIRKLLPEREADLVQVKETVIKAAAKKLSAKDLARIGVALGADEDEAVIKVASDDLDKLVDALMADPDGGGA